MADNSVSAYMEQRVVMTFLLNEGIKPADIYRRLQSQYVIHLNDVNISKMVVRPSVEIPGMVVPSPQQSFLILDNPGVIATCLDP
ncbi:unnamed protein product [Staurois parvus]|uniref:Uncharacterized protein n=1 Tax=Staurois parvus TaxID=386267 RepID=A0ABN9G148_9NEOB|nr:unnamed protein product [Staurois parvus]